MDVVFIACLTGFFLFLQINLYIQEKKKSIFGKTAANLPQIKSLQKSKANYRIVRFLKNSTHTGIFFLFLNLVLFQNSIYAQDSLNIEFGKIKVSDFNQPVPKFDSGADAVIIADIGKTYFEGDRIINARQIFTRYLKVKVLKKSGFQIGDFDFLINKYGFKPDDSSFILKASTFNLQKGEINETKLDKSDIYDEKYGKYITTRKFTLPSLMEGSIFEIMYTFKFNINYPITSWDFQSQYPCLYNEYQVTIPPYLGYTIKFQGDSVFNEFYSKSIPTNFSFNDRNRNGTSSIVWMAGNSTQFNWVKKDVPGFKKESFVNSIKNYISRVSFNLEFIQIGKDIKSRHDFKSTWSDIGYRFFHNSDLEEEMESENIWLGKDLDRLVTNSESIDDKIKIIYSFVREKYVCTSHNGIYARHSLFEIYKNKSGNVSEINLLLVATLRHFNIIAYPAILSTRDNGIPDFEYPQINQYNYLICIAYNGNEEIKLDASWSQNAFGRLWANCYNGGAKILDDSDPKLILLSSDSLYESKRTDVFLSNDKDGDYSGSFSTLYGEFDSFEAREEIRKISQKDYLRTIVSKFQNSIDVSNANFDSLDKCEMPLEFHCDLNFKNSTRSEQIYFNPMMGFEKSENPFIGGDRLMPIEMPYKLDDVYILSMEIPKGYRVDELPKSTRFLLKENQGFFEYIIQQNTDNLQMNVRIKLNKTLFYPEDYPSLREFYSDIIKKESEQIVFKKIH